jgi:hypothetical protein
MPHPSWYGIDACCEHEGTEHCQCWAYRPTRTPTALQIGDSLFRKDNDMRETTKAPIREPKAQTYEFPTEIGDFQVFPVYKSEGDLFPIFKGWSFSPIIANGGDTWGEDDCQVYETAREALSGAVLWAQQEYDGPVIPAEVERVAPHWDRPGTSFNPGGWAVDDFLFHTLVEAIDYASEPPVS